VGLGLPPRANPNIRGNFLPELLTPLIAGFLRENYFIICVYIYHASLRRSLSVSLLVGPGHCVINTMAGKNKTKRRREVYDISETPESEHLIEMNAPNDEEPAVGGGKLNWRFENNEEPERSLIRLYGTVHSNLTLYIINL